jgi:hypothetical protein
MIRTKRFRYLIVEKFFVSWNLKDTTGKMLEINSQNIGGVFYSLIRKITNIWILKTG